MEGTFSPIFEVKPATRTKKPPPISPVARSHLWKVCLTACSALVAMAFGSYTDAAWFNVGGPVATSMSLGTGLWLKSTSPADNKIMRISLLMASAAFVGASFNSDPGLVDIDFCICWALGLWCFYLVALFDRTRMFVAPARFLKYAAKVYIMFCSKVDPKSLFLVLIAKMYLQSGDIMEKARYGDLDYVKHSSDLFHDFKWAILMSRFIWIGVWLW